MGSPHQFGENNDQTYTKITTEETDTQNKIVTSHTAYSDDLEDSKSLVGDQGKKQSRRKKDKGNEWTEKELQEELELIIGQSQKVRDLEEELENLKYKNLGKKDLQVQRNRLTAQLSRDRKKIEYEYLIS